MRNKEAAQKSRRFLWTGRNVNIHRANARQRKEAIIAAPIAKALEKHLILNATVDIQTADTSKQVIVRLTAGREQSGVFRPAAYDFCLMAQ